MAAFIALVFCAHSARAQEQSLPSQHGGINHELVEVQKTLFESIEERIVEAVQYKPWEDSTKPGKYRFFVGGFEKTVSGDAYDIGSRGFMVGIHRLFFGNRVGVGIAAAAPFLETRKQPVVEEETEGFNGAVYAKFDLGRISGNAIGLLGTHEYESSRENTSMENIRGKTDIKVYGTKVSAGLEILRNLPVRIKPEVSWMFAKVSTDAYSEKGVGGFALGKDSTTSMEAGAKVNIAFNSLKTVLRSVVQPEIEGGVYYDFSAQDETLKLRPISSPDGSSGDNTLPRPQAADELQYFVGGKIILSDNRHLAFKVGYRVDFWKGIRSYSGTGQFHIRF